MSVLLLILALPLVLALGIYSVEVTLGLWPLRQSDPLIDGIDAAVLMPAHNEAGGIAASLAALFAELPAQTRILVVADNCSDETATLARSAGAEVVERCDTEQRGKGYALAFGRTHLSTRPPKMVVVVDADCGLRPGAFHSLIAAAHSRGRAAQAVYVMTAPTGASPLIQISNFAFAIKNLVRNRGLMRLGGCALLTGTGMAFRWSDFAEAPLATGDIVEDLGLTVAMIRAGRPPYLVEAAVVESAAASSKDTVAQRRRWEHGFLATALQRAPALIWSGLRHQRRAEVALGMHLLVPPLALLFLLSLLALAAMVLASAVLPAAASIIVLAFALLVAGGITLVARARAVRGYLSWSALLRVPLYILWKIPLYLRFLVKRETRWIRTNRD